MNNILQAKCHVYGNHIDTDRIIPGKYTKTMDLQSLAAHAMEDVDPNFSKTFTAGEIIVAGDNFGCGSSREQAPIALKLAGVSCVIATYFARIFFRNAINIGLPVLEITTHHITNGDILHINFELGKVTNITQHQTYQATKLPKVMIDIMQADGLVNYLKTNKQYILE